AVERFDALATVRADEVAHVLYYAQDWHLRLVEHLQRAARVEQRQVLRGGHYYYTVQSDSVHEALLRLARARRQVNQQIVKIAPQHVLQGAGDNQPGKHGVWHHRLSFAYQQAD